MKDLIVHQEVLGSFVENQAWCSMERFGVVWSKFKFKITQKSSFEFGKEFLYSPLYLDCRIFGQAFNLFLHSDLSNTMVQLPLSA
jgi:hypothetical protein